MAKKDNQIYVLIVDDEQIIRNLFTDVLVGLGYKVIAVENGQKAGQEVKKRNFAVAFIDVHMPVMNGIKTFRAIKKIRPRLPVVMTDSCPDNLIEQAKKEGIVACVRKPFEIKEVIEIMKRIGEVS